MLLAFMKIGKLLIEKKLQLGTFEFVTRFHCYWYLHVTCQSSVFNRIYDEDLLKFLHFVQFVRQRCIRYFSNSPTTADIVESIIFRMLLI